MSNRYNVPESSLVTHIIEDRRASVSPWGRGNSKLGEGVYTYSKLPGRISGSCPGSSGECELVCYAKRLVQNPWVWQLWTENTKRGAELPPLPDDAKLVRIHVSGDFDSVEYVDAWYDLAAAQQDVTFWGYTRSWRCVDMLSILDALRLLPNVHLWASMDKSIEELPPAGWRRAWIEGDSRLTRIGDRLYRTMDGVLATICPEETGYVDNCQDCGFCFQKHARDLVFLAH